MSISLQKGQKIDLTKGNAGLRQVMVGLGWDAAAKGKSIDCDSSAILLSVGNKLENKKDIISFTNLKHTSGAVTHQGDNLTGDGRGDDESILVDLEKLPIQYEKIVFAVNIFMAKLKRQHFGLVQNAFIRIVNSDTNEELCRYNLSENYDGNTAMIFGELYRYNNEWKFNAVGLGTDDKNIDQLVKRITEN